MQEASGPEMAIPEQPIEEEITSNPIAERADAFAQSHFPDDEASRAQAAEGRRRDLQDALRYYHPTGKEDVDQPAILKNLQASEWDRIEELADLVEQMNGLHWHLDHSREHLIAKRDDGSEITIPKEWFSDKDHRVVLNHVQVNSRDGMTIIDALKAIVDPKHSISYKKVQKMLESLAQQNNGG